MTDRRTSHLTRLSRRRRHLVSRQGNLFAEKIIILRERRSAGPLGNLSGELSESSPRKRRALAAGTASFAGFSGIYFQNGCYEEIAKGNFEVVVVTGCATSMCLIIAAKSSRVRPARGRSLSRDRSRCPTAGMGTLARRYSSLPRR